MISRLRNAPIRAKLRFIILTTCFASLVVAGSALFAVQFYFFKKNFIADMESTTAAIASQSTAAADFANAQAAETLLARLSVKNGVTSAALFLSNGMELASYNSLALPDGISATQKKPMQYYNESALNFAHPVVREGEHVGTVEQIGTLHISTNYGRQSKELVSLGIAILSLVLAISSLIAWVISIRLGRLISAPIQKLAETARAIANCKDSDVRAEKMGDDEVGAFTDTFNYMLDQVRSRENALVHEIEERQRAERELKQTQTQLIETSHQAGMAEVATGVLHNVGNVLNSVNVSAALISEKLTGNRLEKLQKTAELLTEKNGVLGEFINSDPKGKLIPSYLLNLSEHLIAERNDAVSELESLLRNIEHIKEIVSMQQSHARVFGLMQRIQPEVLVADAVRMVSMSLQRHQIELVTKVTEPRMVEVDRHKVLQILVNLLRNAKHAMNEGERDIRRITVTISGEDPNLIKITVADTGCGIPAENLTKIFFHGFTTRKDGHGFGLHSSALAAQQMGGRLFVESDGPGCGASFTLELPSKKTEPTPAN